jgi:hypothetical protein
MNRNFATFLTRGQSSFPIVRLACISAIGALFLVGCGPKVYFSPDSFTLANQHNIVAVIPPTISIAANKKISGEAMKEQQRTESLNVQREMYSWLMRRKMQQQMRLEILDVETTNAKLKKADWPDTPMTPAEMCAVLGVDGVLTSNYSLAKPMSEGGAIALGMLAGAWGSTNEARATLDLHDCSQKKLIWNYAHKYSGGIGSSPSSMVDAIMRNATKKSPYAR